MNSYIEMPSEDVLAAAKKTLEYIKQRFAEDKEQWVTRRIGKANNSLFHKWFNTALPTNEELDAAYYDDRHIDNWFSPFDWINLQYRQTQNTCYSLMRLARNSKTVYVTGQDLRLLMLGVQ